MNIDLTNCSDEEFANMLRADIERRGLDPDTMKIVLDDVKHDKPTSQYVVYLPFRESSKRRIPMKLVDILARELKVWPCLGRKLCQGYKGHIYSTDGGDTYAVTDRAEDWELAEVTRDEWQAAVDALKAEKVGDWNGEGLPPVGTVCEWKEKTGFSWVKATVLFISESSVVMQREDGFEWQMLTKRTVFRPIHTPEQIAAEERDKAIEGMIADTNILTGIMSDRRIMAGQLYDAGYRKFEIVDN